MALVNRCGTDPRNTANSRCQFDMRTMKKCVLLPMGARYTGEDNQSFDEWLMAGINAAAKSVRFYPMPEFSGIEDKSEEDTVWTDGYGNQFPMRDGKPAFTQAYVHDYCLSQRLATGFNDNQHRRVIIIDEDNKAWGCQKDDGFTGFEVVIRCTSPRFPTASELSQGKITYNFMKAHEYNKQRTYEEVEMDVDSVNGLEDVQIVAEGSGATYLVKLFVTCGKNAEDVTAQFATVLAAPTKWTLNGAAQNTSSLAVSYDNGAFKVDFTGGISSGDNILGVIDPAAMLAAGFGGYDFGTATLRA